MSTEFQDPQSPLPIFPPPPPPPYGRWPFPLKKNGQPAFLRSLVDYRFLTFFPFSEIVRTLFRRPLLSSIKYCSATTCGFFFFPMPQPRCPGVPNLDQRHDLPLFFPLMTLPFRSPGHWFFVRLKSLVRETGEVEEPFFTPLRLVDTTKAPPSD